MTKYWRYLKYVLKHKAYVFLYGWQLGIPWLALLHDNSKFRPDEFLPYAEFFYGGPHRPYREVTVYEKTYYWGLAWRTSKEGVKEAFDYAWLHHQKRNKHHWQYWIIGKPVQCQWWQTQNESARSQKSSSVPIVAVSGRLPNSHSVMDTRAQHADPTGMNGLDAGATRIEKTGAGGIESPTQTTLSDSERSVETKPSASVSGPYDTTGAIHQPASVAPNHTSSSFTSTTSTGAENENGATPSASAELPLTAGLFDRAFRWATEFFARTATSRSGTTGTVRTRPCQMLREDDGDWKCLTHKSLAVLTNDEESQRALFMPDRYRREMLADWKGAGRAINGVEDALGWYRKNRDKMTLHPETRRWVEQQLGYADADALTSGINVEAFMRP